MITDKLASYAAAKRVVMPGVEHRQHKGLNNRAENSSSADPTTRAIISASSQPDRPSVFSLFTIRLQTSSAVLPTPTLLIIAVLAPGPLQVWAEVTGIAGRMVQAKASDQRVFLQQLDGALTRSVDAAAFPFGIASSDLESVAPTDLAKNRAMIEVTIPVLDHIPE